MGSPDSQSSDSDSSEPLRQSNSILHTVSVELPTRCDARTYDLVVGEDLFHSDHALSSPLYSLLKQEHSNLAIGRIYIISERALADHEGLRVLQASLTDWGYEVRLYTDLPTGETVKSLSIYAVTAEALLAQGLCRNDILIAFGGGVVGDFVGFLAASLLRGIRLIQVPTTLLAQVDSSIGGKVGLNSQSGKNLVGAFYQPCGVFIDLGLLKTLPFDVFASGFAEVFKATYLSPEGENLLPPSLLERYLPGCMAKEPASLAWVITQACLVKAYYVARDEKEEPASGIRAYLNLGHTFAHAYEKLYHELQREEPGKWSELLHGQAVGLGLRAMLRLSQLQDPQGFSTNKEYWVSQILQLDQWLRIVKLPLYLNEIFPSFFDKNQQETLFERLIQKMGFDKKKLSDLWRFVLLDNNQRPYFVEIESKKRLSAVLAMCSQEYSIQEEQLYLKQIENIGGGE